MINSIAITIGLSIASSVVANFIYDAIKNYLFK